LVLQFVSNFLQNLIDQEKSAAQDLIPEFDLKKYLNKLDRALYTEALKWKKAPESETYKNWAGQIFCDEFEQRAAFLQEMERRSPTEALNVQRLTENSNSLLTQSTFVYIREKLEARGISAERILTKGQYQASNTRRVSILSSSQPTPPSQSQKTPNKPGRRASTPAKKKATPAKKGTTPSKEGDTRSTQEQSETILASKRVQAVELDRHFNSVMKKNKEKHLLGITELDTSKLRDPLEDTEDRGKIPQHVEEIAHEIRFGNTYGTPELMRIAIIAPAEVINNFVQNWNELKSDKAKLQEFVDHFNHLNGQGSFCYKMVLTFQDTLKEEITCAWQTIVFNKRNLTSAKIGNFCGTVWQKYMSIPRVLMV
jgi:hypothetical protein